MVQSHGLGFFLAPDPKDLWIVSGQTMFQKRPNDGSSHRTKTRRAALAEAEARSAASAQTSFPARRARERKGRQKRRVTGKIKGNGSRKDHAVSSRQGWR